MNGSELLKRIRKALAKSYGSRLDGVVLYGSTARGESTKDSDIDILVLLKQVEDYGADLQRNLDALYPLALELGRRISAKPIAADEYEKQLCPLYRHARLEGIAA